MKRKWIENPRFTSINTRPQGFVVKFFLTSDCCFPGKLWRAEPMGCRAKPRLGPLNHSPAVWFGAVVCRISIQITILAVRDKQGKVVTGVRTLIDVLDKATRCLARMRALGLSIPWTREVCQQHTKNKDTAIQGGFAGKAILILKVWLYWGMFLNKQALYLSIELFRLHQVKHVGHVCKLRFNVIFV